MTVRPIEYVNQPHENLASASASPQEWHQRSTEAALAELGSHAASGLSEAEVQRRLQQVGSNELREKAGKSVFHLLYEQLAEPLVMILILAAIVSLLLGKTQEFVAILSIVVLNAILGVVQEYRAEQAIAALRRMSQPLTRVRRAGREIMVEARQLVPGDVLLLEAGSIIPADARVLEAHNLRVAEAALTGESQPVDKHNQPLSAAAIPLGDRANMLYMGTSVSAGRAVALVTGTGMSTELGKIADMLQTMTGEKSPLQKRMTELGRVLFVAAFVVMGLAFLTGWLTQHPLNEVLLSSVAIAVAVVPEGLPAVVTISLALGAQRMLKRRALIRKLPAVETLGSVTVIASDKTGTLTENRMTVQVLDVAGHALDTSETMQKRRISTLPENPTHTLLLAASALVNDAIMQDESPDDNHHPNVLGDPTEGAMILAARTYGMDINRLKQQFERIAELPFDSERKRMTTIHVNHGGIYDILHDYKEDRLAISKGAPDGMLDISSHVWDNGAVVELDAAWRSRIEASNNSLAQQGLRVLGVGFRVLPQDINPGSMEQVERDLVFVGLVGIIDPPRAEVRDAVAVAKSAGIRPIMITGDHPLTAHAIAKSLGITGDLDIVIPGRELDTMSDEELRERARTASVFARVSPEHKLRIVRALQEDGQITAMTGDGVNDAPALKQADIGVAMGITGTDVSKEASDMVITDDNFATIVSAVEEGRAIYDNVRRFVKYLLASNTGELFVLLATQFVAGMSMPLTTLQILWMNLITDGIPALALGVEKSEKQVMQRAPYAPNESILGRGLGRHILMIGGTLGILALALGVWAFTNDVTAANGAPAWNTMVFVVLTLSQMGHALGLRSHTQSIFTMNPFSNRVLVGAIVGTLVLQMIAVYAPFFNNLFGTNPLTLEQLLICLVLSTAVFWMVELEKLLIRRGTLRA